MATTNFNESNSKDTFVFYIKQSNGKCKYYKINKSELLHLLGILEDLECKEIEERQEFKNLDEKILVKKSKQFLEFDGRDKWKYYIEDFIVDFILFSGFKKFPVHMYKTGKGFVNGFGTIFEKGLNLFLGEKRIQGICIDSQKKTAISSKQENGYTIIINIADFEILFTEVNSVKKTGGYLAQETLAKFLCEKFPDESEYSDKERNKLLKKMLMTSLDEGVIPFLSKKELDELDKFYQKVMRNNAGNQELIQKNYLKLAEYKLDYILQAFDKNLKSNPREQVWQDFFEENIFIFDSRYIDFIPKHCIKTGRSSEPDFLVYDIYGCADVYEIKKSGTKILQYDSSHDNYYWSTDASKAIAQLEKYLYYCSENSSAIEKSIKVEKGTDVKIIKPKGVLVIGKSDEFMNDEKKKIDFEILRASLKNIEIILYDEMFNRLNNLKKSSLHQEN